MAKTNALAQLSEMAEYNLMDFSNHLLNSSGELDVGPRLPDPVLIALGSDVLELSRIQYSDRNEGEFFDIKSAYTLRNLRDGETSPSVLFDDAMQIGGLIHLDGEETSIAYTGNQLTVGRETTPELELSDDVSREHLLIRIGALQRHIHFADLNSSNGSKVYVPKSIKSYPDWQRRIFHNDAADGKMTTIEEQNSRWTRPRF